MIRLPEIPGLQGAAINMPGVSARAIGAPAEALGTVASAIGSVSESFHTLAVQAQAKENARVVSEKRTALAQDYANLQLDLRNETDPQKVVERTREFFTGYKGNLEDPNLPPAVRDSLMNHFEDVASRGVIDAGASAARLQDKRTALAFENEISTALNTGDAAGAHRALDEFAKTGELLPEEVDKHRKTIDLQMRTRAMQEEMMADPVGWLEKNPQDAVPEGLDPFAWENQRDHARGLVRQKTLEDGATIRDGIITGHVTTPEQVDALAAGLRPAAREILKGELADLHDKKLQVERTLPEYQHKVIGEVAARLDTLDTLDADQTLQVDSLIAQLPTGVLKNYYREKLTKKLNGDPEDTTALEINMKLADDAFRGGWFGRSVKKQSVAASIADGFLTDTRKNGSLVGIGLTPDEAATVAGEKTDALRREKFREVWKPAKAPAGADLLRVETAKAIRDGKTGEVAVEDPQAAWREKEAYGRVKAGILQWSKAHPKASADDIRAEMLRLAAPGARDAFLESAFDMNELGTTPENPSVLNLPTGAGDASNLLLGDKPSDTIKTAFGYPVKSAKELGLDEFFKSRPDVAGMAWGGGENGSDSNEPRSVVYNPYSSSMSDPSKRQALFKIEAARHLMATHKVPYFTITPRMQKWREETFQKGDPYMESDEFFRETLVSRVMVGDNGSEVATAEVKKIAQFYSDKLENSK